MFVSFPNHYYFILLIGVSFARTYRGDSVIGSFYCILESDPTKGPWLSLTDDIYPLFEAHWSVLCPHRKWETQEFWKKHIQDSLSHKKCFSSGRDTFGQTGTKQQHHIREISKFPFFQTPCNRLLAFERHATARLWRRCVIERAICQENPYE
jgi:hypothetical protein